MSFQVTTAFVQQYKSNIYMLAQQKGSRLRGMVRNETQQGKTAFYDQIGPTAAVKRTVRHGDTPLISTPHARRAVTLSDYEWADLIDDQDKIRMLIDPASAYSMNAMNALGRGIDDEIIAALLGTSFGSEDGSLAIPLPASQKLVPTTGAVVDKCNIGALLAIKKKFDDADIDEDEERFLALSSQQLQDLLGTTQVTSSDYNNVHALVQGKIDTYMGFKFIRTQRLPVGAAPTFDQTTGIVGAGANAMTNARSVLAWAKSGVLLSVGDDMEGRIDQRADKSYATQVYARMSVGATRLEEVKVVQCICKESSSVVS